MVRRLFLGVLLSTAAVLNVWLLREPEFRSSLRGLIEKTGFLSSASRLALGPAAPGRRVIRLHEPEEFDSLSKAAVLGRREKIVREEPSLIVGGYQPHHAVFGGIEDGRPWWGFDGLYLYGPGERSPEGLSDESRSILNPFMFIGLIESNAYIPNPKPPGHNFFPKPVELELNLAERRGRVRYSVKNFVAFLRTIGANNQANRLLDMTAFNARDFGFNFLWVDTKSSPGAYWFGNPEQPEPIQQYIHNGGSCRYPGGCNNMSPEQKGMHITLYQLPAKISVALWERQPKSVSAPADFTFVVEVADLQDEFDLAHTSLLD